MNKQNQNILLAACGESLPKEDSSEISCSRKCFLPRLQYLKANYRQFNTDPEHKSKIKLKNTQQN